MGPGKTASAPVTLPGAGGPARRYRVAEAAAAGAAAPPPGTARAGGEAGDAAGRHDSRTRLKVMSYQVVSRCSENCLKSLVMPCLRD